MNAFSFSMDYEWLRLSLPLCALQKEILLSDVVVCSVAYILTFAITASTVFLSLKVSVLSLYATFYKL